MNIAKGSENLDLFMPPDELEDFRRYLSIAIEDLVNIRPKSPKKYLALALCRAIPADESLKYEFPELEKDLVFEETMKIEITKDPAPESPSKNSKFEYPEGFTVQRRGSVCGESMLEESMSWSPPVNPKSPEVQEELKRVIKTNALFSHIGDSNLEIVALAFESLTLLPNTVVVKQHDEGNSCFFIQSGKLSVFVEERGFVCEYGPGDSFGEASIMYGNIRGATIKTITDVQLWKLDRFTYKKIIVQAMLPTGSKFTEFIKKILPFQKLDNEMIKELAKHSTYLTYDSGNEIKIASTDRYFYIVEKGKATALKNGKKVADLKNSQIFGGRAIFDLEEQADTIRAENECAVYRIPEQVLDTLLKLIKEDLREAAVHAVI